MHENTVFNIQFIFLETLKQSLISYKYHILVLIKSQFFENSLHIIKLYFNKSPVLFVHEHLVFYKNITIRTLMHNIL